MASSLIGLPFRPTLNNNGTFEAGAILAVYKIDSSTFQPIFADANLTTPLANPLRADGYGVFPAVYYDSDQPIRVVVQDSKGATLFDLDPYIDSPFEAEAILDQATARANEAAAEATRATAAADACSAIEATVQALVGPTYASIPAGLAATPNGQFFAVVAGDVVSIYLNSAGTAVLQRSILSATAVQTALDGKAALSHTHAISDVTGLQTALDAKAPLANPAFTGTPTTGGIEIGYRSIPRRTTTTTAVVGDRGGCVAISAGFTVPASVFSAGDAISIYNNSASPVTITQGAGLTLRQAGTANTGNRTLAGRGIATVWFNSATEAVISGGGLT